MIPEWQLIITMKFQSAMRESLGAGAKVSPPPQGTYSLVGILSHSGESKQSGHYYYCGERERDELGWWKFDDLNVTQLCMGEFDDERLQKTAYGLLYRFKN
jgi:uncharacterized UBP type Zn finger protein